MYNFMYRCKKKKKEKKRPMAHSDRKQSRVLPFAVLLQVDLFVSSQVRTVYEGDCLCVQFSL